MLGQKTRALLYLDLGGINEADLNGNSSDKSTGKWFPGFRARLSGTLDVSFRHAGGEPGTFDHLAGYGASFRVKNVEYKTSDDQVFF